jgi:ribose 5-phosphate isomerase B
MADKHVISIGCDHAGFETKVKVIDFLQSKGYPVIDHGTFSTDSVDYPDFVHPVADDVESGDARFGIILCGSGNGTAMAANKHQGIRAALCWTEELAALARQHNDANVLSIPARFISVEVAIKMTDVFLNTDFEGGRHTRRVQKIACSPVSS